ncbi:MAG: phosphohistidine phosphatase SixA [Gemmatimonadetes bacterium]|nr:phosphohistidine phosphatase SixA [Gemmatimonadota bacterium]
MNIYLVQHGEAKPEQADPSRPLTERGRREVERMAHAAGRLELALARICHSGKLRAQQTAEIFAARLRPAGGLRQLAGLAPNDDPAIAAQYVAVMTEPEMLVGHLPHLSRLASLLLIGDATRELIAVRMGGIVCIEHPDAAWRLKWMLTPDIVLE